MTTRIRRERFSWRADKQLAIDTSHRVKETFGTSISRLFDAGRLACGLLFLSTRARARPVNGAMPDRIAGITAPQCAEQSR
jgi:hypothetical protein